jgi:hypothetical protein
MFRVRETRVGCGIDLAASGDYHPRARRQQKRPLLAGVFRHGLAGVRYSIRP